MEKKISISEADVRRFTTTDGVGLQECKLYCGELRDYISMSFEVSTIVWNRQISAAYTQI